MSDLAVNSSSAAWADDQTWPALARYGSALALVAAAIVMAFALQGAVATGGLTLLFVLPVVISASAFGWGPSLTATVAGVLAYDFFFTEPKFSFAIASWTDICDAALLLAIGAIVSGVASNSRRQALESRRAADQAEALRVLAHEVLGARTPNEGAQAAAVALSRMFRAPSAVFRADHGDLELIARIGQGLMAPADEDAARVAADSRAPTRATAYPSDGARYDFWPIATGENRSFVLGVDFTGSGDGRPPATEQMVELVGGYLAASFGGGANANL